MKEEEEEEEGDWSEAVLAVVLEAAQISSVTGQAWAAAGIISIPLPTFCACDDNDVVEDEEEEEEEDKSGAKLRLSIDEGDALVPPVVVANVAAAAVVGMHTSSMQRTRWCMSWFFALVTITTVASALLSLVTLLLPLLLLLLLLIPLLLVMLVLSAVHMRAHRSHTPSSRIRTKGEVKTQHSGYTFSDVSKVTCAH